MTITSEIMRMAGVAGNGATTSFSYTFKIFDEDHLLVISVNDTTGVETTLTIATHYTVTGVESISGGTVEMIIAPAAGTTLHIILDPEFTQRADLNSDEYEEIFDKTVQMNQRAKDLVSRALRVSDAATIVPADLAFLNTPDTILGFNSGGSISNLTLIGLGDIASVTSPLTLSNNVLGIDLPLNNFTAVIDPVVTDDSNSGYSAGSRWLNTVSGDILTCTDATAGAAVWDTLTGDFVTQEDLEGNLVPVGMIMFSPTGVVPMGYLACEGATFDALVYPALNTFLGGNTLPDMKDRVSRGAGALAGGAGTTQEDSFQGHYHQAYTANLDRGNNNAVVTTGTGNWIEGGSSNTDPIIEGSQYLKEAITDGVNGTPRIASETRVKSYIGKFVIKAYASFVGSETADLVAMEVAINGAVRNDTVQAFGDGGAQARANIGVLGQSWEHISTVEIASAVSSLDFVGLSQYRTVRCTFSLAVSSSGHSMMLRTSTDNGATFDAGGSDYKWSYMYDSTGAPSGGGSATSAAISMTVGLGNSATMARLTGMMAIENVNNTEPSYALGQLSYVHDLGNLFITNFGGIRTSYTAMNAFRLILSSGNITSGHVILEGVKS